MKIFAISSDKTQDNPNFTETLRDLYFEYFQRFAVYNSDESVTITVVSKKRGDLSDEDYIKACINQISEADEVFYFTDPRIDDESVNLSILIQILYAKFLNKGISIKTI